MAEIVENCEFIVGADDIQFNTQTNGDTIIIRNLELSQGQAATLAWLINGPSTLKVEIKLSGA